jgi:wyosine [tRNA(Phe)-imidazoG37] synthetase (radical SAM superfamily)
MIETPFFRMKRLSEERESEDGAYFSCKEIEGALTFVNSTITLCGHVHNENKGMPVACEYSGGDIPADKIISAKKLLQQKNQTDEDTPCKGCQFLQKKNWSKKEYLFDHITIGHYTICNLQCNYCYITDYTKEQTRIFSTAPYNAADSIADTIKQGLLAPNATAWLTAGEPTLFTEFEQILNILLKNEIRTTIGTNCIRSFDIIKKGLQNNLIEILCSVDAGTSNKYHEIKGQNFHQVVWDNLEQYAQLNNDSVIVKYIFMDENASGTEVLAFINMCRLKQISKISISRDIRKYRGVLSASSENMPEQMFRAMALMMFEAIKNNIEVYFDVNWPVFSDDEIFKIKSLALEIAKKSNYCISDLDSEKYFKSTTHLSENTITEKSITV